MSIIKGIDNQFKLPIQYIKNVNKLDSILIKDLELTESADILKDSELCDPTKPELCKKPINTNNGNTNNGENNNVVDDNNNNDDDDDVDTTNSIYSFVFNPKTMHGKKVLNIWSKCFTTNKKFLTDSQKLYNAYSFDNESSNIPSQYFSNIINDWDDLIENKYFKEKFGYIELSYLDKFNNSPQLLQYMSIHNLLSPIVSLLVPFVFLLIPYAVLKIKNININLDQYYIVLKEILKNHALGQVLFKFKDADINKKIYIILSFGFYLYQIYHNIQMCLSFYKNMKAIHTYLFELKEYLNYTINSMNNYLKYSSKYKTYKEFNDSITHRLKFLTNYKTEIDKISKFKLCSKKIFEIGYAMTCFYKLHSNPEYKNAIIFSFGFNGYIDNINGLKENLVTNKMNFCKYTKNKCSFKNIYYPALVNKNPVKNSYNLNKKIIITGPNAAGKTTLLKSTIINIVLSQQIGCGFYETAKILPYDYIHCYLNIPDTSGRDSLFQAEARRCKDIINLVIKNTNKRHFCIFDELYSGTNPYEAIGSSYSFLEFLTKYKGVDYMLTTHYTDLCHKLKVNNDISNYYMKINSNDSTDSNQFKYTYKLHKGISAIKGGVKVLNDLNYPNEIIRKTKDIICEYN